VLDSNGKISERDLEKCQTPTDGPPARRQGSQYAGAHNSALNYRVCTTAPHISVSKQIDYNSNNYHIHIMF